MKRLKIKVVMSVVVLGMALVPQTCEAHEYDFRVGTYDGNWCGLSARFEVKERIGKSWKFKGKIFIRPTGQYDDIEIEQFADNGLVIRRILSGQYAGKVQQLIMEQPETIFKYGVFQVNWRVHRGSGPGSNNLGHLLMPKK